MRVPRNSTCHMALMGQSGNENCFSVISIFIILANSPFIRKYFMVLIFTMVKSKQLTTDLGIGVLKGRDLCFLILVQNAKRENQNPQTQKSQQLRSIGLASCS